MEEAKMPLAGKVAILTGGARGIGRAVALELIAHGVKVAFTYHHSKDAAVQLCEEIEAGGGAVAAYRHDVSDYGGAKSVFDTVLAHWGRVDLLVNNAGIKRDRALALMQEEDWRSVIDTNLYGTINLTRAVITAFVKQKSGSIVNITSVSGLTGLPGQTNYSASKAGIIGFTKALAKEVARYGITINAVAPGFIATDMLDNMPEKARTHMLSLIPMQRCGDPVEVARELADRAPLPHIAAGAWGSVVPNAMDRRR